MQPGLTTVNIGGEIRTLSFKNNFIFLLGKFLKVDPAEITKPIMDIAEQNEIRAMTIIVYVGLCAYQERQGNYQHGITLQQCAEWVDDADETESVTIWKAFFDILGVPKVIADRANAEKKKQQTTKLKKK